jgi:phosphopantothenoylcysteine decarboxylase/phosphopantothenate--cysteine ligase
MADELLEQKLIGVRVALGVTGGIAAYKAAEILRWLQRAGCTVRVAMTRHACELITPLTFRALSGAHVIVDDYAPDNPDPIAHITFSQTVDLLLIAPATANIIAKFAHGIADDFLTTTYLACQAPVIIAPAMNTTMWNHPVTRRNLARLRADGAHIIEPDTGEMACGTIGPGRLSEPERIVEAAMEILQRRAPSTGKLDLRGERILITAGATREAIDPVRFISNRSSGRMGFALGEAARVRGADQVTIIAGVTSTEPPADARMVRVTSAEEMRTMVMHEIKDATIFISAAAIADYRPIVPAATKIKKDAQTLTLTLERTPDILAEVAQSGRDGLLIIGFAAETEDVLGRAREKLERKHLDLIVANDITYDGAGFDVSTNIVTLIARDQPQPVQLPLMSKREVADRILDEALRLRSSSHANSSIERKRQM